MTLMNFRADRNPSPLGYAGLMLTTLALGSMLPVGKAGKNKSPAIPMRRKGRMTGSVVAARRLNRAAGTLASSVFLDSAVEHYRGSFKNKAMFTPLVVSALALATSLHGTADRRPAAHRVRDVTYLLAAATGLIGSGFHVYNVTKRVGGLSWQNLFYGAPLGLRWLSCYPACSASARSGCETANPERALKSSIFPRVEPWPQWRPQVFWAPPAKPGCFISAAPFIIRS
jgi:hypothetical protein